MIAVNKIEYFIKEHIGDTTDSDLYKVDTPWLRIKTSKGDMEIPLSENYTNDWWSKRLRKFEELSSNSKMFISYDFSEE